MSSMITKGFGKHSMIITEGFGSQKVLLAVVCWFRKIKIVNLFRRNEL